MGCSETYTSSIGMWCRGGCEVRMLPCKSEQSGSWGRVQAQNPTTTQGWYEFEILPQEGKWELNALPPKVQHKTVVLR